MCGLTKRARCVACCREWNPSRTEADHYRKTYSDGVVRATLSSVVGLLIQKM